MEISEEIKLELVKKAINTEAGWKILAASIKTDTAKQQCIEILRIIGNDKVVDISGQLLLPFEKDFPNQTLQLDPNPFNVNISDQLVKTLEMYMENK